MITQEQIPYSIGELEAMKIKLGEDKFTRWLQEYYNFVVTDNNTDLAEYVKQYLEDN